MHYLDNRKASYARELQLTSFFFEEYAICGEEIVTDCMLSFANQHP